MPGCLEDEIKKREEQLYQAALAVEQDEALNAEMTDWEMTWSLFPLPPTLRTLRSLSRFSVWGKRLLLFVISYGQWTSPALSTGSKPWIRNRWSPSARQSCRFYRNRLLIENPMQKPWLVIPVASGKPPQIKAASIRGHHSRIGTRASTQGNGDYKHPPLKGQGGNGLL